MFRICTYKIVAALASFFLLSLPCSAQIDFPNIRQPLLGKMLLSASYLELRENHFHSGIDVKVGGVVGAKLFAIDNGYISRVQVRAGGYGKCLYIKHSNGTTSVYGHLNEFASPIDQFVEDIQYEKQQFEVDTLLLPEQLPITKGELIGYAGNTGNSFGPHLHFEIRDTAQTPLNGVNFYTFADTKAPSLNTLAIFSIDSIRTVPHNRTTHLIDLKAGSGNLKVDSIIHIESPAFIGLECTDRMDDTHNKFGVRKMNIKLDEKEIFSATIDNIPFQKAKYINSFMAYDEYRRSKKMLMKSYVEPGNALDIYTVVKNSGLIVLNNFEVHRLTVSVTDDYGNTSTLNLRIQEKKIRSTPIADNGGKFFRWNKDNFHISNELIIHVPKHALYNNMLLDIERMDSTFKSTYSSMYRLHNIETPLHKPIRLAIKANIPDSLQGKALIAYHSSILSAGRGSIGGEYSNGYVNALSSSFGYFYVTVDTIPPTATPKFKDKSDLRGRKEITVTIWDDLSGIKSYNGYIDDEWVLFEYDAKRSLLIYTFDKKRIKQGKKHKLVLEISDRKNNMASLTSEFTW